VTLSLFFSTTIALAALDQLLTVRFRFDCTPFRAKFEFVRDYSAWGFWVTLVAAFALKHDCRNSILVEMRYRQLCHFPDSGV
jgi:hypothetical protein